MDSVKFSGSMIAGLSLLSGRIMRLEYQANECVRDIDRRLSTGQLQSPPLPQRIDIYLPPRSIYILSDDLRYLYTHSILGGNEHSDLWRHYGTDASTSQECTTPNNLDRRLSVIFRDFPNGSTNSSIDSSIVNWSEL